MSSAKRNGEKLIIQGGGEHARVVLDCALALRMDVLGLFDPKYKGSLFGVPQWGTYNPSFEPEALCVVAIGNNDTRKKVALNTHHHFTNIIHPSALLSSYAAVGTGTMVLHGAIIQAQAKIGNHVIVNTGAQVDHDCVLEDYVHIAPGAVLCGNVYVGEGTLIGSGAVVVPGVKIGSWVTVGAGSVVTKDIPNACTVVGVPAKHRKRVKKY